jgi:hypothetical protein
LALRWTHLRRFRWNRGHPHWGGGGRRSAPRRLTTKDRAQSAGDRHCRVELDNDAVGGGDDGLRAGVGANVALLLPCVVGARVGALLTHVVVVVVRRNHPPSIDVVCFATLMAMECWTPLASTKEARPVWLLLKHASGSESHVLPS